MSGVRAAATLAALLGALPGAAETIVSARYEEPVVRYGHFALGRPHEYARAVARTDAGRSLELVLPADQVFEDRAPRIVRLAPDEPPVLLVIISSATGGGALALLGPGPGALEMLARSAPIGTPNRWLNPVGVADLDGDGIAEVAAVITPHIGGRLTVYRRAGARLEAVAAMGGFSNHVYGSPELALSTPVHVAGDPRLVVPDQARRRLRIVALEGVRLRETGRCPLEAPVTGPVRLLADGALAVGTSAGVQRVTLSGCALH